ncbi:MAG: MoxR family ATPase [Blastocatellia bacterium]|nr:MoxR family ATPase [Blastocatellia bacterium]
MENSQTLGEIKSKVESYVGKFSALKDQIARVIVGQEDIVEGTLFALMAGGHVLIEGVPGLGKTLLVRTLAETCGLEFARVQFTPDLMPADIVGTNIIVEGESGEKMFRFQPGPVFTNLLLADEVNRATPKTQSALLEAMQERQVTVSGKTYPLEGVFFVMATQNPLEMEGTYPLPEAQLDRFIYKLIINYPARAELIEVLRRTTSEETPHAERVVSPEDLSEMQRLVREVIIAPHVEELAADLLLRTHPGNEEAPASVQSFVRFGASPRGAQAMVLTAKARALLAGRYNVSTSDILAVARPSLRHRIILNFEGEAEGLTTDSILDDVLQSLPANQSHTRRNENERPRAEL